MKCLVLSVLLIIAENLGACCVPLIVSKIRSILFGMFYHLKDNFEIFIGAALGDKVTLGSMKYISVIKTTYCLLFGCSKCGPGMCIATRSRDTTEENIVLDCTVCTGGSRFLASTAVGVSYSTVDVVWQADPEEIKFKRFEMLARLSDFNYQTVVPYCSFTLS